MLHVNSPCGFLQYAVVDCGWRVLCSLLVDVILEEIVGGLQKLVVDMFVLEVIV